MNKAPWWRPLQLPASQLEIVLLKSSQMWSGRELKKRRKKTKKKNQKKKLDSFQKQMQSLSGRHTLADAFVALKSTDTT